MATKNTNNKLTLGKLKSASAKRFTQRNLTVEIDGEIYNFLVDEHVDIIKLNSLAEELMEKSALIKVKKYKITDKNFFQFLICKYFTNIEICNTATDFAIQVQILLAFINFNVLEKITEIVPIDEINELMPQAVNNAMENLTSNEMGKQIEANPSLLKDILGDKNKEFINMLVKTKELKDLEEKSKEEIEISKAKEAENIESSIISGTIKEGVINDSGTEVTEN